MDPSNPVVGLCAEGMKAEGEGRHDDARDLFMKAWEARTDDYEACIASHFVARHQDTPQETLRWNQISLSHADLVGDERVQGFYPSLYLNMGHSYELLGNPEEARRYYDMAAEKTGVLSEDRYGNIVRSGIEEGKKRLGAEKEEGSNLS